MLFRVALLLLAVTAPSRPIVLTLTPRFSISRAQDVRFVVKMDPHRDNRTLVLTLDGPEFHRSTVMLEGEGGPLMVDVWFKGVRTPGDYVGEARLVRADREEKVDQQLFCLGGGEHSCSR
jgi:hypothetical protein